jgi:hypothetical protein
VRKSRTGCSKGTLTQFSQMLSVFLTIARDGARYRKRQLGDSRPPQEHVHAINRSTDTVIVAHFPSTHRRRLSSRNLSFRPRKFSLRPNDHHAGINHDQSSEDRPSIAAHRCTTSVSHGQRIRPEDQARCGNDANDQDAKDRGRANRRTDRSRGSGNRLWGNTSDRRPKWPWS